MEELTQELKAHVTESWAPELKLLLSQTKEDLYWGPSRVNVDYPGFTSAIEILRDAIDTVGEVYYDMDEGIFCEGSPTQYFDCPNCNGEGCGTCSGDGYATAENGHTVEYSTESVKQAVFGRELTTYIYKENPSA